MSESIGERFESQPNALNFLRLCLALEVVLWHAYALRGDAWLPEKAERFVSEVGVDSFFAISGFLICRAWCRRSSTPAYVVARVRRIFPGLWVCLLVTAVVIAPMSSLLAGGPQPTWGGGVEYVIGHADTWHGNGEIDATPAGVTAVGWNASLWTLGYECLCYVAVALLGLTRALRPIIVTGLAVVFWAFSAALVGWGLDNPSNPVTATPRFGLMFCLGALLWMHRDRIPVARWLAAAAAFSLVAGALTSDYRLVAAPGLAYLCLYLGVSWGRFPRLVLRNDISYGVYIYGFPLQQAFLVLGVTGGGWVGFAALTVAAVLPVAALSWFLVERRAAGRHHVRTVVPAGPQPVAVV